MQAASQCRSSKRTNASFGTPSVHPGVLTYRVISQGRSEVRRRFYIVVAAGLWPLCKFFPPSSLSMETLLLLTFFYKDWTATSHRIKTLYIDMLFTVMFSVYNSRLFYDYVIHLDILLGCVFTLGWIGVSNLNLKYLFILG